MLPAPDELERICKGLAALDAMLSEDWESRYFSFNCKWSGKDRVAHVLAAAKLNAALVARLSTERSLGELADDLGEIGYGR